MKHHRAALAGAAVVAGAIAAGTLAPGAQAWGDRCPPGSPDKQYCENDHHHHHHHHHHWFGDHRAGDARRD